MKETDETNGTLETACDIERFQRELVALDEIPREEAEALADDLLAAIEGAMKRAERLFVTGAARAGKSLAAAGADLRLAVAHTPLRLLYGESFIRKLLADPALCVDLGEAPARPGLDVDERLAELLDLDEAAAELQAAVERNRSLRLYLAAQRDKDPHQRLASPVDAYCKGKGPAGTRQRQRRAQERRTGVRA